MSETLPSASWLRPPVQWGAVAMAVVATLLLHTLAWWWLPRWEWGRFDPVRETERPRFEIQRTRTVPSPALSDVSAFAPTRPESLEAPPAARIAENLVGTEPSRLPESSPEDANLMGKGHPLAAPDRAGTAPPPVREELMAVTEALFSEAEAALPRRMLPEVTRTTGTPDFTRSVEARELRAALPSDRKLPVRWGAEGVGVEMPSAGSFGTSSGGGSRDALPRPEPFRLDQPQELNDPVTTVESVENLLDFELQTYLPPGGDRGYFRLSILPNREMALPVMPRQLLFVQDASASMTEEKLDASREGLLEILRDLQPSDQVEFLAFSKDVEACFGHWAPMNAATRSRAAGFIRQMRSLGMTDVQGVLDHVAHLEPLDRHAFIGIFISDGRATFGELDPRNIIHGFTRENSGRVSLFGVGGGRRADRFLLDMISYLNRGDALIVRTNDEFPDAIAYWIHALSRPILVDLGYITSGLSVDEVYPRLLPHLYMDQPLELYGRYPVATDQAMVQILGISSEGRKDILRILDFREAGSGDDTIRQDWARHAMHHRIAAYLDEPTLDHWRGLTGFAGEYNLQIPYLERIAPEQAAGQSQTP